MFLSAASAQRKAGPRLSRRTPLGRAVLADSKGTDIDIFDYRDNPNFAAEALAKVSEWSDKKKLHAAEKHQELEKKAVRVLG